MYSCDVVAITQHCMKTHCSGIVLLYRLIDERNNNLLFPLKLKSLFICNGK